MENLPLTASTEAPVEEKATPTRWRLPMALVTWAFVLLVLLIVGVLLVLKVTRGSTTVQAPPVTPANEGVVREVTNAPARVFDTVGALEQLDPAPVALSGQPSLVVDGKPDVVYVGGEFSPYSAAERWALVAALGRFGVFTRLGATSSSKGEVFAGTPTFSFYGSTYRSRYLTFSSTEEYAQSPSTVAPAGFPKLEGVPSFEQALMRRYGSEPSGAGGDAGPGALPFVDVANKLVISGAAIGFSPGLLAGKSMAQIAGDLSDPSNPVSSAVIGAANELTAAVCSATGGEPANVCSSPGAHAGAARLGLG
jgi:hypothetical protein